MVKKFLAQNVQLKKLHITGEAKNAKNRRFRAQKLTFVILSCGLSEFSLSPHDDPIKPLNSTFDPLLLKQSSINWYQEIDLVEIYQMVSKNLRKIQMGTIRGP